MVADNTLTANAARQFNADANGSFIILRAHVPFSGQRYVKIDTRLHPAGGLFQLAIAPPGITTFTNVNNAKDTYAGYAAATILNLGNPASPSPEKTRAPRLLTRSSTTSVSPRSPALPP